MLRLEKTGKHSGATEPYTQGLKASIEMEHRWAFPGDQVIGFVAIVF